MTAKCDCLNECGDDPGIKAGRVKPCPKFAEKQRLEQARNGIVVSSTRFQEAHIMVVTFETPLTAEQQSIAMQKIKEA